MLNELPYDIHEFESGLLGDIEPSDLYEGWESYYDIFYSFKIL